MRVEELRTELNNRGLSTTGTKPTLVLLSNQKLTQSLMHPLVFETFLSLFQVRRLEAALRKETRNATSDVDAISTRRTRKRARDSDSNHTEEIAVAEEAIEDEKLVTATKKGVAVLDQWLPDSVKTHYHVLQLVSL